MSKSLSIAIVGAGLGGLTAALCLRARGMNATVYEQAQALGEIGAGVHISPNGIHVMQALGLGRQVDDIAARPRSIVTRHYGDSKPNFEGLFDEAFVTRFGAPFYSFHRADLHAMLTAAVQSDPATPILLNHRLQTVEEDADGVRLTFEHGEVRNHDIVVGADGVHSRMRSWQHGDQGTRFTGHVAYRGMVEAHQLADTNFDPTFNIWVGPGKHVVAYPVRRGELINYVALVEEPDWHDESWTTLADADQLAGFFEDWNDSVQMLVQLTMRQACYKWALLGRDPLPHWSTPRTTLIGDAAHPMVPYLAQGAVMAVEDAWVLAACLAQSSTSDVTIEETLQAYESARIKRTSDIQEAAWQQGQLNHAVGRDLDSEDFRGGKFSDPGWIYGYNVVKEFA